MKLGCPRNIAFVFTLINLILNNSQKVLFIGSFLSKKKGTIDVAEKIKFQLIDDGYTIILSSKFKNKIFRFLDAMFAIAFFRGRVINFDVFSTRSILMVKIGARLARLRSKYVVFTLRGGGLGELLIKERKEIKKLMGLANLIQSPSHYLIDCYTKAEINVEYLPNPINLSHFPYKARKTHGKKLLWVRAFDHIYNPTIPILILENLLKTYPDTTLTMVGPDKGLLKSIRKMILEKNLGNSVEIVGPVNNNDLFSIYHTHDVFLSTSSYESFGTAILEAASCGIPIVVYKVGEIPFLWSHLVDVLMVNELNANKFSDQIAILFDNPELVESISKNARVKAEMYDWKNVKTSWINLLKNGTAKEI